MVESAFSTYLPAIRARWMLVAVASLAGLAGAAMALSVLDRRYEATAEILVAPLHITDETFIGVGMLRDTGDPARTAQTAARLVEAPRAADLAAERLGPSWDRKRVLAAIRVETRRQSNLLGVVGKAKTAQAAADVANAFAESSLAFRERLVQRQLEIAIGRLRSRLEVQRAAGTESGVHDIIERLTALEAALHAEGDPTLTLARSADLPGTPVGASPWRLLLLALLGGLVLGALGAVLLDSLDSRVRDQHDLDTTYRLPTLAAVPRFRRGGSFNPAAPTSDSLNAFHTVRAQLQHLGDQRTILVTSASSGDGRTTTANGLALAMVEAGERVLLIDLDLRKPDLTESFGVRAETGLPEGDVSVTSLAVEVSKLPGLFVLGAIPGDRAQLEDLAGRLPDLLSEALELLVDYVIIDSPPLGEVSAVLQLAGQADDVLVVARTRNTQRARLRAMRDMLDRAEIHPVGMVLVGQGSPSDIPPLRIQRQRATAS